MRAMGAAWSEGKLSLLDCRGLSFVQPARPAWCFPNSHGLAAFLLRKP
jgi:hypothetical protein